MFYNIADQSTRSNPSYVCVCMLQFKTLLYHSDLYCQLLHSKQILSLPYTQRQVCEKTITLLLPVAFLIFKTAIKLLIRPKVQRSVKIWRFKPYYVNPYIQRFDIYVLSMQTDPQNEFIIYG